MMNFDKKNHKKIKDYAKTALDLASPDSNYYHHSLDTYAKALWHVEDFEESYKFYDESLKNLINSKIDNKDKYIMVNKLKSAMLYSNIDFDKSISMIENALNIIRNSHFKDEYKDEIEKAEKFLKDNK